MRYHAIEFWNNERTITIDGRAVQVPALVEDDDGVRILVVADYVVQGSVWGDAHGSGAAAIALLDPEDDETWLAQTVEAFMETRTPIRDTKSFALDADALSTHTLPPNYRTIVQREMADPNYDGGFVHLHAHSEFSALDGLSRVDEMVQVAKQQRSPALCLTDHAICAGHPDLSKAAAKAGLIPIFGIEANLTGNRLLRPDLGVKEGPTSARHIQSDYHHLIMWAETDEGLRNLWAMSTIANVEGFYYRPRLDWEVLEAHADGVMCSTACLRGPLSRPILDGNIEQARANLARLTNIFGDRVWIELHANRMEDQIVVNKALAEFAHEYSVPTIAVTDSHYACADDKATHKVWIASQTGKSLTDDASLFAGDQDYHLLSEDEVRRNLDYLPAHVVDEAIGQTVEIAHRCKADIRAGRQMPVFSRKGGTDADRQRVVGLCVNAWSERVLDRGVRLGYGTENEYLARFEREARLLSDKGYWGYFLVVWEQTDFAKRNGVLVGPGRGSGSGSLIAYLLRITEIDPIEADLMFERFLTEGRDSPPDFDIDYPSSKREMMQNHVVERWGYENTLRVGTHTRLRNKSAVRDMASALRGDRDLNVHWPDIEAVSKIIDEAEADTAGLGMDWNFLWVTLGDIPASNGNPLTLNMARAKYPELFRLADRVVGRLKTYGRHAAGMVISTDSSLLSQLPLRVVQQSGQPISEFDMKALELLGLLKFDILTLRTLDTLQGCIDLITEHYGVTIDPSTWIEEYADPLVWDELCDGNTLGVFQIETVAGTRLTREFKPRSIADLADVGCLNRPGPQRSGLAAAYLRRRAGKEPVTFVDPRLTDILAPTQGTIIYQEQVMAVCQVLGGYTLAEADDVRRMLGKKEVEKVVEAGREFVARCVERGMTEAAAVKLWGQLGEFAKYSFNKSHAWAYAMIGYWCAWFKFHFPSMFFTALLSTIDKGRIPEFVPEARRMGYQVRPPDVNASGKGFRPDGGIAVRYGLDAIKGVGASAVDKIVASQPYTSVEDFQQRSGVDSGITRILANVGAFDTLEPNRRALEDRLGWMSTKKDRICTFKDPNTIGPNGLPCTFDWSSEPVELTKRGQPKPPKPPPRQCTVRCRHFTPPSTPDFTTIKPYSDDDIRDRERELLGFYLSSTPFDRIPPDQLERCATGAQVDDGGLGDYLIAAIVNRIKTHTDRRGKKMAFLSLDAQGHAVEVAALSDAWAQHANIVVKDGLCVAIIRKEARGNHLKTYIAL